MSAVWRRHWPKACILHQLKRHYNNSNSFLSIMSAVKSGKRMHLSTTQPQLNQLLTLNHHVRCYNKASGQSIHPASTQPVTNIFPSCILWGDDFKPVHQLNHFSTLIYHVRCLIKFDFKPEHVLYINSTGYQHWSIIRLQERAFTLHQLNHNSTSYKHWFIV